LKTFARFAGSVACLLCIGGQAGAESAREFWQNEWRQPRQEWDRFGRPAFREPWFGQEYGYAVPEDRRVGPWRQRKMPAVRVSNPDFLTYTPEELTSVALGAVCAFKTAANTSATLDGAAGTAAPTDSSFMQACAAAPENSLRMPPQVGDALARYYSTHPQFLWSDQGGVSARAQAAIAKLSASDAVGLDPADYRVALPDLADADGKAAALLRFELELSARLLTYVLDATRGRIDPNRLSGYHDLPRKNVDLLAALGTLAQSSDVAAYLESRNPDSPQFRALVAELAKLRGTQEPPIVIEGSIAPGDSGQLGNVIAALQRSGSAALREKYRDVLASVPQIYDGALVEAMKAFQKESGLRPDGIIGPATIRALTGDEVQDKPATLRMAMERLRWLPSLGTRYVFLNQPAFEVSYVNGADALTMRAIIGKPDAQTYFFTDRIKEVVYNPYWNVPRSIVINEMLPKLWRDPSWLDRQGYEVNNSRGRQVASSAVDWSAVAANQVGVDVRQPPGGHNALGRLKIEFPNRHAIYMHDTNQKHLFAREQRALSHGCVRLQHPREMAAALLGTSVADIERKIAGEDTRSEKVPGDIPVYLAYFTAWPDAQGNVRYYRDVYQRDVHLARAIVKTAQARVQ